MPVEDGPLVRVEDDGAVTTLTLDSPHNRNALSARLLRELHEGLEHAARREARLVVLTGTGSTFCSGADLSERLRPAASASGSPAVSVPEVLSAIRGCPCPVLCRVNGHVRAGGLGLVAASDLAVAPRSATFAFTEVRVGVVPAVIAVPAVATVSSRALTHAALTGIPFDAAAAEHHGFLTTAVEDLAAADRWIEEVAGALLAAAPAAVAGTKSLLWDLRAGNWNGDLARAADLSDRAFSSGEAREGLRAFLEKRPPNWVAPPGNASSGDAPSGPS